jgi:hypothetical protein
MISILVCSVDSFTPEYEEGRVFQILPLSTSRFPLVPLSFSLSSSTYRLQS